MITTLITVPFLTEGIDGCTEFFSDVEIVAFEPVSVSDLTGPVTFVGIEKVVVLVTSPLAFVVTPGRALGDEDTLAIGDGLGEVIAGFVAIGVGDRVTTGS